MKLSVSLITGALAAVALTAGAGGASAAAPDLFARTAGPAPASAPLLSGVYWAGEPAVLEETQFYWGNRNYCWYAGGWHGPGFYWCGYAWRRGYGWGGPVGWHGWHGGGYYHGGGHYGGGHYGGGHYSGGHYSGGHGGGGGGGGGHGGGGGGGDHHH